VLRICISLKIGYFSSDGFEPANLESSGKHDSYIAVLHISSLIIPPEVNHLIIIFKNVLWKNPRTPGFTRGRSTPPPQIPRCA
jgi:hypothetical protein